jgi:hypothetical protein
VSVEAPGATSGRRLREAIVESHYESDETTSPLAIHPYPKQQSRPAGGDDRRAADQEARATSVGVRPVRYEDFFEDDEGASRSA